MLSYDSPIPVNGQTSSSVPQFSTITNGASSSNMAAASHKTNVAHQESKSQKHHHIWLVTGPAGCGKTTVAQHLAESAGIPYLEGDKFHPEANIKKMSNGIPLSDADRWDWLANLRDEATKSLGDGDKGVVVTCSALKRKYRDVIRVAAYYDPNLLIHFIYLNADKETLKKRVAARQGHYMGPEMVDSQFDALEQPESDEMDIVTIDVSQTPDEVKRDALNRMTELLAEDTS